MNGGRQRRLRRTLVRLGALLVLAAVWRLVRGLRGSATHDPQPVRPPWPQPPRSAPGESTEAEGTGAGAFAAEPVERADAPAGAGGRLVRADQEVGTRQERRRPLVAAAIVTLMMLAVAGATWAVLDLRLSSAATSGLPQGSPAQSAAAPARSTRALGIAPPAGTRQVDRPLPAASNAAGARPRAALPRTAEVAHIETPAIVRPAIAARRSIWAPAARAVPGRSAIPTTRSTVTARPHTLGRLTRTVGAGGLTPTPASSRTVTAQIPAPTTTSPGPVVVRGPHSPTQAQRRADRRPHPLGLVATTRRPHGRGRHGGRRGHRERGRHRKPHRPAPPRSPVGPTGTSGTTGVTGCAGATGVSGMSETTGATDSTGPTGPTQSAGSTGPTGPTQSTGWTGGSFPRRHNGSTGSTGVTGPSGHGGSSRSTAGTGTTATGTTGSTGKTGPAGTDGETGPTNTNGTTGATGSATAGGGTDATGPTGPTGSESPTGPTSNAVPSGPAPAASTCLQIPGPFAGAFDTPLSASSYPSFAALDACGYPSPDTAGVPPGTNLTPVASAHLPANVSWSNGELSVSGPATITGISIADGFVAIGTSAGVTFSDDLIRCSGCGGGSPIINTQGNSGVTITHSTIGGTGGGANCTSPASQDIGPTSAGATLSYDVFDCAVEPVNGSGYTLTHSYVIVDAFTPTSHNEAIYQPGGGSNDIEANTLLDPLSATAVIFMDSKLGTEGTTTIKNNLIAGAGYGDGAVYGGGANVSVTGNRFSGAYGSSDAGEVCAATGWSGNFADGTLATVAQPTATVSC